MDAIQAYALQTLCMNVAACGIATLIASLILTPLVRSIHAAGERFWDRVDARAAARRR